MITDSFLVNHSSLSEEYASLVIGTTTLQKDYSIRIDTASSQCSDVEVKAWFDELKITLQ